MLIHHRHALGHDGEPEYVTGGGKGRGGPGCLGAAGMAAAPGLKLEALVPLEGFGVLAAHDPVKKALLARERCNPEVLEPGIIQRKVDEPASVLDGTDQKEEPVPARDPAVPQKEACDVRALWRDEGKTACPGSGQTEVALGGAVAESAKNVRITVAVFGDVGFQRSLPRQHGADALAAAGQREKPGGAQYANRLIHLRSSRWACTPSEPLPVA